MRYSLMMMVSTICLGLLSSAALRAEDKETQGRTTFAGVLIDQHCAGKMMKKDNPEKAASGHTKTCCLKCAKDHGMALISGKTLYKLDGKGKELAVKYLEQADNKTNVVVTGQEKDGTIAVTSIEPAKG